MFSILNMFWLCNVLVVAWTKETWDPVTSVLCRATCLSKLLEPDGAEEDRTCAIEPDCFVCWEHCGTLSVSNTSREILCKDNQCSEGCETACNYFQKPKPRSATQLVFPEAPKLDNDTLMWPPVSNASLYSIVLVYSNTTRFNIAQTVSCSLKIPQSQLARVGTIVVIAVNNIGGLGISNYQLPKRIVKKNVNSAFLKEKLLLPLSKNRQNNSTNSSSILNQALWITQNQVAKLDETLVKANISWEFTNKENYQDNHQYMIKWWVPDLNMEGKSVVNGSLSTELIYRLGHICLVKVKVVCTDMESQIIVLKEEHIDSKISKDCTIDNVQGFLFGCIVVICAMALLISKLINTCKDKKQEKSISFALT